MRDIWQAVSDTYTISIKENVRFQVEICLKIFKFMVADYQRLWRQLGHPAVCLVRISETHGGGGEGCILHTHVP